MADLAQREELQKLFDAQPGYVGSRGVPELEGIGNYNLDIKKTAGSNVTSHRLWFFDSRSYTYYGENGTSTGAYGQVLDKQLSKYSHGDDADRHRLVQANVRQQSGQDQSHGAFSRRNAQAYI